MVQRKWRELSPRTRRLIVIGAAIEAAIKAVALVDLKRRPADRVRGPKRAWGLAISFVNSFGVVPVAYFLLGRRRD
ncbi:MAG: hypothetical protein ACRDPI_02695 [Nocardioidaceae bacterium]